MNQRNTTCPIMGMCGMPALLSGHAHFPPTIGGMGPEWEYQECTKVVQFNITKSHRS